MHLHLPSASVVSSCFLFLSFKTSQTSINTSQTSINTEPSNLDSPKTAYQDFMDDSLPESRTQDSFCHLLYGDGMEIISIQLQQYLLFVPLHIVSCNVINVGTRKLIPKKFIFLSFCRKDGTNLFLFKLRKAAIILTKIYHVTHAA